jgi:hypothetical protein
MKKYYIFIEAIQSGPFDIDELKSRNINENTPIWYTGLDKWTTAGKVEELKDILNKSTPPPFTQSQKITPPIPNVKSENTGPVKKKSKTGITIGIIAALLLILVVVMIRNNPDSIPGFKIEINTPKPILLSVRADDKNSTILKIKETVYARVQNQGGSGNVIVTFHISQDGNNYERTKSINLQSNEIQDIEETFDEVTRLGGQMTYSADAKAQ